MADFCEQCAWEELGIVCAPGYGDLARISTSDGRARVLCEGCGPTLVDYQGVCQGGCVKPGHNSGQAAEVAARAADLNKETPMSDNKPSAVVVGAEQVEAVRQRREEAADPDLAADRAEARRLARELTPESIAAMPTFDAADHLDSEEDIAAFEAEILTVAYVAGLDDDERAKALAGAQSVVARARARLAGGGGSLGEPQ